MTTGDAKLANDPWCCHPAADLPVGLRWPIHLVHRRGRWLGPRELRLQRRRHPPAEQASGDQHRGRRKRRSGRSLAEHQWRSKPDLRFFLQFWRASANGTRGGGVMCINFGSTLTQLTDQDGTAATIMLTEVRTGGHLSPGDPRGTWAMGMPGASVTCGNASWDCTNPNDTNDNSDDIEGGVNDPKGSMGAWQTCPFQQAQVRSRHTGGGQTSLSPMAAFASLPIASARPSGGT